jgi:hypothetical protein
MSHDEEGPEGRPFALEPDPRPAMKPTVIAG